jgi:hypothetical protein
MRSGQLAYIAFYAIARHALNGLPVAFRWLSQSYNPKDTPMDFGKRLAGHGNSPAPVVQQTCVRCCGTGRIRERGDRIICKACRGTGRIDVVMDRAS